ncbi:hypothetical protein PHYBLDRAFT_138740 [Phycomyces blakesleeanus NRRL 1555(-)]|uniref:DDE Tnp4 domain-containing protein n=1 Tax=Phycomyces blakesleeanus (strain ATCC 8743b / DSM 1359 / FGSC 10004 / NBRC 33097 / NRRL 1555) TaxID=763407 RepID=A0A163ES50_PHYB8|nr:hypothetical protein PHYBLDRAFT_138740 [Phycomyces blakesleeanus NRRL 1555(-)]OAD81200.1 hypothetical protein PHYBLDRAFT_138740 [Phycomyces blakesleeanus NRRL 1555(-)]|eukprot:XP_018299240.1 hypothetical protein PHYBLDRAFT_138740 [Phycomyces blakesleeanus NRRL 1555(-)]
MNLPLYLEFKCSKSYTVRIEGEFAFALVLYCGLEFDTRQFSSENYKQFTKAIHNKNKTFPNVVGFVDGTMQKYWAIEIPDGITSSLVGLFIGSTHDARIFDESKTLDRLIAHLDHISKNDKVPFEYVVYEDMAYPKSDKIYRSFPLSEANNDIKMEFRKVLQLFKFCKYNYGMKILANTKPATIYILLTLFKNFHTCINSSASSKLFKLQPPNIHDYIKGLMHERQPEDTIDSYKTILNNASNLVETITVPDNQ